MNATKRSNMLLRTILGILFVIFIINLGEAINIENGITRSSSKLEILVAEKKMSYVRKRALWAFFNIVFTIAFATTSILLRAEEYVLKFIGGLEPQRSIDFVLRCIIFPLFVVALHHPLMVPGSSYILSFGMYIRIFLVLILLGDFPTRNRVLMTATITFCTILTFTTMVDPIKTDVLKSRAVPYTEEAASILQEFLESIGDKKKFNDVYVLRDDKFGHSACAYGIFEQNIYSSSSLMMTNSREVLLGVLSHEAGHCYYRHCTILFVLRMLLFLTMLVMGSWFILKSDFAEGFINGMLFNCSKQEEAKKPSTVMKVWIFLLVVYPAFRAVSDMGVNIISRQFELQADRFAVRAGYGEGSCTYLDSRKERILQSNNKIYSILYDVHPHHSERIERMQRIMKNLRSH